jgi:uncharacterized membrane protein YvbJ
VSCPSCAHENRAGARFCARCRTRLPRACLGCGTPAAEDDIFCTECGDDLPGAAAPARPAHSPTPEATIAPTAAPEPVRDAAGRRPW